MSIFTNYETLLNSIYQGPRKGDQMTFQAWRRRTQDTREVLVKMLESDETELKAMENVWAPQVIEQKRAELESRRLSLASIGRQFVTDDLNAVIEAKRAALSTATGAPTDTQLRLIQTLALRDTLDAGDISAAASHCASSLAALNVLRDLANRNGVPFPKLPTVDDFEEDVASVEEYCNAVLPELDQPDRSLGYMSKLFWTTSDYGTITTTLRRLDDPSYLTAQEPAQTAAEPQGYQDHPQPVGASER